VHRTASVVWKRGTIRLSTGICCRVLCMHGMEHQPYSWLLHQRRAHALPFSAFADTSNAASHAYCIAASHTLCIRACQCDPACIPIVQTGSSETTTESETKEFATSVEVLAGPGECVQAVGSTSHVRNLVVPFKVGHCRWRRVYVLPFSLHVDQLLCTKQHCVVGGCTGMHVYQHIGQAPKPLPHTPCGN
jgi:hypothetical protein